MRTGSSLGRCASSLLVPTLRQSSTNKMMIVAALADTTQRSRRRSAWGSSVRTGRSGVARLASVCASSAGSGRLSSRRINAIRMQAQTTMQTIAMTVR
jgi:hypothetical protein